VVRRVLAILLTAGKALAAEAPPASPLLPPGHWAVRAAERLHEVGLAPDWLPSQRAVPLLVVGKTLEDAARLAGREAPQVEPLTTAWTQRFRAEFPGSAAIAERRPALLGGVVGTGYSGGSVHELAPAGPPLPADLRLQVPRSDPFLTLGGAASFSTHFAAGFQAHATPSQVDLDSAELVGSLGKLALSVGRTPVGYGPGAVGAVVASGRATVERVELMTTAPVRFAGPLGFMGDFAIDTTLARFSEPRHPYHPLLWEFEVQWRPCPRLTLAAIRGVMFGGALWEGTDGRDALLSILGMKNGTQNNVYSGSIAYRLPTEAFLPLALDVEWGSDDNPGAMVTWPGLVAGLKAPMLPGLLAEVGVEYAYFGRGPFGWHQPVDWYGHWQYVGGWATSEMPLGDPLGGNGRALRLTAAADPWDGRVRLSGLAWLQDRYIDKDRLTDNLYARVAGGRSVGALGEVEWRLGALALVARGSYERGRSGWSRSEVAVDVSVHF